MIVPLPLSKDQVAVNEVDDLGVTSVAGLVGVVATVPNPLDELGSRIERLPSSGAAYAEVSSQKNFEVSR